MGEWISVDESLPERGQNVLTVGPKGSIETARFKGICGDCRRYWTWNTNCVKTITHWMVLPKPPKEVKYENH